MTFIFVWLTSLSMIISRSIHVAAKWHYFILFLCLSNIPLCILGWPKSFFQFFCKMLWTNWNELFGQPNIYHIFFIHSSVNGHLGCFHVLAIVNSAAMNIGVHVSLRIMVFSGYMPRSGIAGSYGSSIFSF